MADEYLCMKCGRTENASRLTLLGGFEAWLCIACSNEWYRMLISTTLHHRMIRLDAKRNYLNAPAIGAPRPSEDDWLDYHENVVEARADLFQFAEEWLAKGKETKNETTDSERLPAAGG